MVAAVRGSRSLGSWRSAGLRPVLAVVLAICLCLASEVVGAGPSAAAAAPADTPACECAAATGAFVAPVAGSAVPSSVTAGTVTSAGDYTATWNANGTVAVKKSGTTVLTVPGTGGGFGKGQKAFVAETLTGSQTTVNVYNLTATHPGTAVFTTGENVTSDRMVFSPSGHYLLYIWTTASGPTPTHFQIADATASSAQPALWQADAASSAPPGQGSDSFGSAYYGWGPDDSRFVYGTTANGGSGSTVSWYWTDLAATQQGW